MATNRLAVIITLVIASLLSAAQTRALTTPIWTGSVRCDIDIKGPGYVNHQTHVWTLTGALAPDGNPLDYPATWSVSGGGSLQPTSAAATAATWKIQGAAPGVRMAIFVRQSDQRLLVFTRHGQLNVPDGTLIVRQPASSAAPTLLRNQQVATAAFEWRPFPVIADVPTSTHITGSSTTPITERLDATQPLGSQGQSVCTWDLAQGAAGTPPATAPAGGVSGTIASPAGELASGATLVTRGATTPPPAPAAAGCDADVPVVACVLPNLRNGLSLTHSANFHIAGDTSDWFTVTATMSASEAPFAVIDVSLSGGTVDGSYSIEVSDGALSSLRSVGSSGAAHAPRTTVAWATESVSSKTLFIEVRHVAGSPANDLYTLRLAMNGSQTAPLTVLPISPAVISALPSLPTAQTGTIAPARRSPDAETRALASSGATSPGATAPPAQDNIPNTCANASAKTVSLSRGSTSLVTGAIEADGIADWLVVHFPSGVSLHLTIGNAASVAGASNFQVAGYSSCASMIITTTGTGTKSLDFPDSGPHDVIVHIVANPWNVAYPSYTLRLEGR